MGYSCCISKCHNTWRTTSLHDKKISFHRFPKPHSNFCRAKKELIIKQRNAWISAINRKDILENELHNFRVCSVHFVNGSPAASWDTENTAWKPTLKLDDENDNNTVDVEMENSNSSPVELHIESTTLMISEQTNKYECWIEEKNLLKLKLEEMENAVKEKNKYECLIQEKNLLKLQLEEMENAVKERDLMLKENEKNLNRSYTKLNKIESDYKEMETKFKNSESLFMKTKLKLEDTELKLIKKNNELTETCVKLSKVEFKLKETESKLFEVEIKLKKTESNLVEVEKKNSMLNVIITENKEDINALKLEIHLKCTRITTLKEEINEKNEKIKLLHEEITDISKYAMVEESFVNNDVKVNYFTGMKSYGTFKLLMSRIEDALFTLKINKLDNFQKLLLTLMKLRFNMQYTSLSYRFNILKQEASVCFQNVCVMIDIVYQNFIKWPSHDELKEAVPMCFLMNFGRSIAVIIDCFEVHSERPSNIRARASSFSNYKHNYTVKYLIGITPQGSISFISRGFGGRASDKYVTIESGILDKLQPFDKVMADRGFTIADELSLRQCQLIQPNFMKNKQQMSPNAVESTRKIANCRIHIERVISVLRNRYRILKGPVPINYLKGKTETDNPFFDTIVRVACILVNMRESVVPMS